MESNIKTRERGLRVFVLLMVIVMKLRMCVVGVVEGEGVVGEGVLPDRVCRYGQDTRWFGAQ